MDIINGISIATPDIKTELSARRDWAAAAGPAGLAQRQQSFTDVLSQAKNASGPKTDEERARETAQDFVAMAFVQPLLKQLRESNNTPPPFGPGKGEQQFRALMDAQVARNVVQKSNWPVVDRLARDMLERVRRMKGQMPGGRQNGEQGTQNT